MKGSVLFFLITFLFVSQSFAQKDIIVTIGDKKITKSEFEQVYKKNNTLLNDESEVKTPSEYMELFIDYKLKVIEAENQGLDTAQAFIDELKGYRDELAKTYLTDVTVTDSMIKEAYDRSVNEIRASHILLNIPKDATSEDSLKIYNKLIDIRNKFISGEKTFEELAFEYSEDPSAKQNKGDLGYFKAFGMVAPFENAAYNTRVGEVSMPFATQHGFHICYVTDKVENTGEIKVAHLMKIFKNSNNITPEEDAKLKHQADSLYALLKDGADFARLVRDNSDDFGTARKDGEMRWLTQTFSVKEFYNAAIELKENGDISEPVRTPYGWHIIKRLDYRKPLSMEEMWDDLEQKVKRDPIRSQHSQKSFIEKRKRDHHFIAYEENIDAFKNYLNSLPTDTLPAVLPEEIMNLNIYKIGNSTYTVKTFFDLQNIKKKNDNPFLRFMVLKHFALYADEVVLEYEDSVLEQTEPEFNQIIQEYHDGMLLFSIMEKEVWNKAVADSVGLEKYYEQNIGKYTWDKHFDGFLIRCYDTTARATCDSMIAAGVEEPEAFYKAINVGRTRIKVTKSKWEKGTNDRIDYLVFGAEKPFRFEEEQEYVHGKVVDAGEVKTLNEARGLYISDYQKVMEDEWIESLRNKYNIKVNTKLLKKVKSL